MQVCCPHCGYGREVAAARIPAGPVRATCPSCGQSFSFSRDPEPAVEPAPPLPVAPPVAAATPNLAALPKAGFWIRVVASLIDSVLVTLVQLVLGLLFSIFAAGALGSLGGEGGLLVVSLTWLFSVLLAVSYYVVFTGYGGQTPGKMALRIRVVRVDGRELGYSTALFRETLGKFVSGLLLGAGYLMVAFDEQKQGLHDRMAKTYVVKL